MARRNLFESDNPMFKEKNYQADHNVLDADLARNEVAIEPMTVSGAVNKTFMMMGVMLMAAVVAYALHNPILMWTGFIGIPVISFIASRNVERSHIWGPLYGIALGFMAGTASYVYGSMGGGIILQAVSLTMAIMFTMLMLYKTGTIKVTEKFRSIMSVAVGAIMLVYLVNFILYMFGINMPFLHEASPIGIGISLVIVAVASLKLLVDFDNFYKGEAMRAPAYMEWYFGMGLMFTLVWLYLEIIRLVAIFASSD